MAKRGRKPKAKVAPKKEQSREVAVAKVNPVTLEPILDESYILKAFDMLGIGAKLDTQQKMLFVEIAKLNRLNPLKREIHAVPMQGKLVPVTGYEVYIQRARDTGLLQYWKVVGTGNVPEYQATLIIKRRDWPEEFEWTVDYKEVKRQGPMWQERPKFMTQKVAISQGFRLCFGEELGGMPYTVEEMGELNGTRNEPRRASERKVEPVGKGTAGTSEQVFDIGSEVRDVTSASEGANGDSGEGSQDSERPDERVDAIRIFAEIVKKLNSSTMDSGEKIVKMKEARENRDNAEVLQGILNGI